jgi:hypothetical protein
MGTIDKKMRVFIMSVGLLCGLAVGSPFWWQTERPPATVSAPSIPDSTTTSRIPGWVRRGYRYHPLPAEPCVPVPWYTAQAIYVPQEAHCCGASAGGRGGAPAGDA